MGAIREFPADHDALRHVLLVRRDELTAMLQARIARLREESAAETGSEDDDGTSDLDVAMVNLASATLRRIAQALDRLDMGDYGRCTRCGTGIGEARLRALPFALHCRSCEAARETEEVERRSTAAVRAQRARRLTDEAVPGPEA